MLQGERQYLRKILKCTVEAGLSSHEPPYHKKATKTYTYLLECGHTVVRHGQLAGERKIRSKKSIICDWCKYGEEPNG